MSNKRTNTRALVECALMIAAGTVLAQIKIFTMPYGGSVTLVSMLPFILVSYRHGVKWGLFTGFVNSLIQMLTGFYLPPAGTFTAVVGMILLDYMLAFMCLGLACVFAKPFKNSKLGVGIGTAAVCFMRFMCRFLSGALRWGSYQSYYDWAVGLSVWEYSFIYNASYMMPELLITTVAAVAVCSVAPKFFTAQK
ncbi:MAG: energy-coupled thiamine transporter ThiT [Oscillospiraceae bacterium]|nr:energy-coupled thiamine transporter ThiT [Oscillospiraceae bacterium]